MTTRKKYPKPSEMRACQGCGHVRQINMAKRRGDTPLCAECTAASKWTCPDCGRVMSPLGKGAHRKIHL